ncbi:6-phosphofructokinase subunit beta [Saccharomycopsis crataegensis]|uniref:ATP-dependent 6-phosphofructokinase n=1 Tax=Saccharomycopsis crataegensis TaxID=43959 RepID=A0AAV5QP62_9ASCO|nr:6-phosphofructokinase subunit beta [Saccharomycopsis crataegensis]
MVQPLVQDISYFSLSTSDEARFQQAREFYCGFLQFKVIKETSTTVWLSHESPDATSPPKTVRIALDSKIKQTSENIEILMADLEKKLHTNDWRSLKLSLVFKTNSLATIYQRCLARQKSSSFLFQTRPDNVAPVELYLLDPLGNLIGFTSASNTFSSGIPQLNVIKKEASKAQSLITPGFSVSHKAFEPRNIAVMTSGGDAPGMNANVRSIVRTAIIKGCRAFAIYEGYEGLVRGGPEYIREMGWDDVRGWLREGGTNIGTARCKEFRERAGRLSAAKNLIDAGIDALIVCGGDGSLTGADVFRHDWPSLVKELLDSGRITEEQYAKHEHLNICGTVGSIDNDMSSTDATIGAYSSLARICQAVDYIDATANSHARAFVIEVMGRHCGWLALMAGIATSADYILIPEKPASSQQWQEQMCQIVSKHRERGKRKTIVLVAEGAITNDLVPISTKDVADVLINKLGLDTRITTLGHVQRGGTAVAYDRMLATLQGVEAVEAVLECTPNTPSPMIGIEENKIVRRSLVDAVKLTQSVAEAISEKNFKKAMSLRDTEFSEHLNNFIAMNSADHNVPTLPVEKRLNIAIINVGAPAGGMNSAIYSMATYCMSKGHTPYAIANGFPGLVKHGAIKPLDWIQISDWNSLGGSEIGTNRATPSETDLGMIAFKLEQHGIDGLILVGGFEAFVSLKELEQARNSYPAFRIPLVLIPATISNNVPGTEYSLGADTCLNSLMEYCDIVKQSASATRNRVFVVEVQGGNSGYIATYGQLISGASLSYVPEEGISLEQLEADIEELKTSFKNDEGKMKAGRLFLKSQNASNVLSAKVIADIVNEESNGRFEARTAIPGHVQQGGIPSPIDRTRGARLACRAVEFIEQHTDLLKDIKYDEDYCSYIAKQSENDSESIKATAVVVGVKSNQIVYRPICQLYDYETEVKKRMPKSVHWKGVREVADKLVGRSHS